MTKSFDLLSVEDIDELEDPAWLVHGIIPRKSLIQIFGKEWSGKTFFALDIALRVAAGMPWRGSHEVHPGRVVYVVGEGVTGIKKRIAAWRDFHKKSYSDVRNFRAISEPVQLGIKEHVAGLAESIEAAFGTRSVAMIVFDTQSRCTAGIDENSQEEMTEVIQALDWLKAETGAAVVLIHHVPLNAGEFRARGSSTMPGALDTTIGISKPRESAVMKVVCTKQKDFEAFGELQMFLRGHAASCVVEPLQPGAAVTRALAEDALTDQHLEVLAVLKEIQPASFKDWLAASDLSKSSFHRARSRLMEAGFVVQDAGSMYRVQKLQVRGS